MQHSFLTLVVHFFQKKLMGMKLASVRIVISLVVTIQIVHGEHKEIDEWLQKTSFAKEKITKLHFYFHETVSGENISSVQVAQSSTTNKPPTFFGVVNMVDDPLTYGPELTSKQVGKAQGIYGSAGLQEISLLMVMNLAFTDGTYSGSTLALLGRNVVSHPLREMPIVGGSGIFRFARGFATAKTFSFNTTSGNAVVEYSVLVFHY